MKPLDQFIHEDVMGLKLEPCDNCGTIFPEVCRCDQLEIGSGCALPSYSRDWSDYGDLLKFIIKQKAHILTNEQNWYETFGDPLRGSKSIARDFGWQG